MDKFSKEKDLQQNSVVDFTDSPKLSKIFSKESLKVYEQVLALTSMLYTPVRIYFNQENET